MNKKEELNLKRLKKIIEKRKFDEYDIIAFLIIIRPYLEIKDTPLVLDFANGVAHRKRDKGNAFTSLMSAAQNNYELDKNRKVKNYNGINNEKWKKEWFNISNQFNIKITPIIISEITLCIFSIAQLTEFEYNESEIKKNPEYEKYKGRFELLIDDNSNLHLSTFDGKGVCYGRLDDIEVENGFKNKFFFEPVETIRINKKLYLQSKGQNVLHIKKKKSMP